ncbi:MAG: hypothetical protein HQ596_05215 [Candidatus Saganbacteria bacterium]|nr:hypothetical protein [Candidatus Saganbacteria bacterium]
MKKAIILFIIIFITSKASLAIYSPRAMGMGEAFTAIADDAYAAYWNPAGFAVNPGIDLAGTYQMNNRNQAVGDNALALKGCFEIGMDPFAWIIGVGAVSLFAYDGAVYLADQGVVKKGWGREGDKYAKEESMAEGVKEKDEEAKASGTEPVHQSISRKVAATEALKHIGEGTIFVGKKYAKVIAQEMDQQGRHYFYVSPWFRPNYYRPTIWDDRYDYVAVEITPMDKAQFGGGITILSDQNASIDQDTNWYSFSLASGWGEIAALGANLNIYDLRIPSINIKGLGAGLDVGGLLRISNKLMFGITAKELLTTDIKWENGAITRYQTQVNMGIGLKPIRQVLVAADVHNLFGQNAQEATMHYGIEVKPVYGLALRAGLSDNSKTAGLSLGIGQLIIDYAYLGGTFNRTQMIGATWKI